MRDLTEEVELGEHPIVRAANQVVDAVIHLERPPGTLVSWPWDSLTTLTGPMGGGEVWFVAAYSGGGKTSFIASAIDAWRLAGRKIYVMPLELEAKRFRTYLACMELGVPPGEALSGRLSQTAEGKEKREALKQLLYRQSIKPYVEHVMVSEQRAINVAGLKKGLAEAQAFGADVVIVDHIDHIQGGDGSNGYADSKRVNHEALAMAQDAGLLLVFTTQLNMEIGKGNYLAKYMPPMPQHVQFPSVKLQVATGMIGLFRPIRSPRPGEPEKEYTDFLAACRTGSRDVQDALEPNTMGVVAMKLRNFGHHEGKRIALRFDRGRVTDLPERDLYTTAIAGRGPRP